jgi:hypothetical protein
MSQVDYPTSAKSESKPEVKPVATWRKVLAAILDFITVFALGGYTIASFTGDTSGAGFELNGWPALLLFAIIILYFTVFSRYLGGTLWQRLLRTR